MKKLVSRGLDLRGNQQSERKKAYFEWSATVVQGLRGVHPGLEALFDSVHDRQSELV